MNRILRDDQRSVFDAGWRPLGEHPVLVPKQTPGYSCAGLNVHPTDTAERVRELEREVEAIFVRHLNVPADDRSLEALAIDAQRLLVQFLNRGEAGIDHVPQVAVWADPATPRTVVLVYRGTCTEP
jgi:hypothetical protein